MAQIDNMVNLLEQLNVMQESNTLLMLIVIMFLLIVMVGIIASIFSISNRSRKQIYGTQRNFDRVNKELMTNNMKIDKLQHLLATRNFVSSDSGTTFSSTSNGLIEDEIDKLKMANAKLSRAKRKNEIQPEYHNDEPIIKGAPTDD